MEKLFFCLTIFAFCLSIDAQPYNTGIDDCKTKTGCTADNNASFRNGTAHGARIEFDYIKCSTNTNIGNAVEICINDDPLKPADQRVHGCEFECQAVSFGWSYTDAQGVDHIGSTACHSCRPAPTPTPNPGACGGVADFSTFPTTGCSRGLTLVGNWCDLSLAEQSSCNGPTFYDYNTCSCPDGVQPTPTPTPEECFYEQEEEPSDPSGYGELLCDLCQDGYDNDCEYGTDLEDYKCSQCTSPVVIDTLGDGFNLTSAEDGVDFDITGVGKTVRVAWTQGNDAWLALDRNGNGTIDSGRELFGAVTLQPNSLGRNGFLALAEYDKPVNGGNGDGVIDSRDTIFSSLRLWLDENHNGFSEQSELHTLSLMNVGRLDLDYREAGRVDAYGNRFRYRAKVRDAQGAALGRWAWDVFLTVQKDHNSGDSFFGAKSNLLFPPLESVALFSDVGNKMHCRNRHYVPQKAKPPA